MSAQERYEISALKWVWRLQGIPAWLQRIALWTLAALSPDVACLTGKLIRRRTDFHDLLDHSPQSLVPSLFRDERSDVEEVAKKRIGMRMGAWRIKSLIGVGGMGAAYLASRDDGAFRRDVALKCMHEKLRSRESRHSFDVERDALARLNHSGIVSILDGGIAKDGTPWFVMPFVGEKHIGDWCDGQRLSIRGRMQLLVAVCDALAYAHGQGVLHQDIKPSAVMIDGDRQPKLLDFGLAAFMDQASDRAAHDSSRQRACSLGFSAPELVMGASPSVAADVYSIGALMYALLCARVPLAHSILNTQLALVAEREPSSPSEFAMAAAPLAVASRSCSDARQLARHLRGDLDAIAKKCVAIDPDDRYASVGSIRDDLVSWLEVRPISLRDAPTYRLRRFISRNLVAAAFGSLLVAIALAVAGAALWQRQQAFREIELSTRAGYLFGQALASAALSRPVSEDQSTISLLDRTEANLRGYSEKDPPDVRARGLSILARNQTDAGNYGRAERLAHEAARGGGGAKLQFAFNQVTLARLHNIQSRHGEAVSDVAVGLDKLRFAFSDQERLARLQLRTELAAAQYGLGDGGGALNTLDAAIDECASLGTAQGDLALAQMLILRGSWYRQRMMIDASEMDLNRAVALASGTEPRLVDDARESLIKTVRASRMPGREKRALAIAKELLEGRRASLGDQHPQTGVAWGELAFMQMLDRDHAGALASVERADGVLSGTLGRKHPTYARVLTARSQLLLFQGKLDEAVELAEGALAILEQHYGSSHELTLEVRFLLAHEYWWKAAGDEAPMMKALSLMRDTIAVYEKRNGEVPALHRMAYADMLFRARRQAEAEREIARAREDAVRQYGSRSEEMLSARMSQWTMLAQRAGLTEERSAELETLIADASRVDPRYGRAILFSLYMSKARQNMSAGAYSTARSALANARELAVRADSRDWLEQVGKLSAELDADANG